MWRILLGDELDGGLVFGELLLLVEGGVSRTSHYGLDSIRIKILLEYEHSG